MEVGLERKGCLSETMGYIALRNSSTLCIPLSNKAISRLNIGISVINWSRNKLLDYRLRCDITCKAIPNFKDLEKRQVLLSS